MAKYVPLFFMALHDIVVVCLFMFDGMLYDILVYGIYFLLKSFPNCHCVCHPNNNVCTPFNNFVVVVTMDHRSSLDRVPSGELTNS